MSEQFYILSLKWSRHKDHLIWYRRDCCGYTYDLAKAGVYTLDQVRAYCNGDDTIGVPVETAQRFARRAVGSEYLVAIDKELEDDARRAALRCEVSAVPADCGRR